MLTCLSPILQIVIYLGKIQAVSSVWEGSKCKRFMVLIDMNMK